MHGYEGREKIVIAENPRFITSVNCAECSDNSEVFAIFELKST